MNEVSETVRQNCLNAVAKFNEQRASRSIESSRAFWQGRVLALRAAARLNPRAARIILSLKDSHATNPRFQSLCLNLCQTKP